MAFFNDPKSEQVEDLRKLDLLRTFERRLWDHNIQVDSIVSVCFGVTGPPYSRGSLEYRALVSKVQKVGMVVVDDKQHQRDVRCTSGVSLLIETTESNHVDVFIVNVADMPGARTSIFEEPITKQELDIVLLFVLSFKEWCGRA